MFVSVPGSDSNNLLAWLQWWPIVNEAEMTKPLWYTVRMKPRLREIDMLQQICSATH